MSMYPTDAGVGYIADRSSYYRRDLQTVEEVSNRYARLDTSSTGRPVLDVSNRARRPVEDVSNRAHRLDTPSTGRPVEDDLRLL